MITSFPNISSSQSTLASPWALQVARGKVDGASQVNIFAFNNNVGTSLIPVWENATAYTFPASALTMTLVSTSASDNSTARVVISGLTTAYVAVSETVALNGVTGVTTVNTYLRINSIEAQIMDQIRCPVIVLYPGKREGKTSLRFLEFYPADPNYRSEHID